MFYILSSNHCIHQVMNALHLVKVTLKTIDSLKLSHRISLSVDCDAPVMIAASLEGMRCQKPTCLANLPVLNPV